MRHRQLPSSATHPGQEPGAAPRSHVASLSAHPRWDPASPPPLQRSQVPSLSAHPRWEPGSPPPLQMRGPEFLSSLAHRHAIVVGLARSGVAATRLLRSAGAEVLAVDDKPASALGETATEVEDMGAQLALGPDAAVSMHGIDLVVVSPGVPLSARVPAAARAAGVPVIGELELGWRAMEADTIAITGTNGKTTTTTLTGALLAEQVRPVLVAGNIGTPLTAHALTFPADEIGRASCRERA